jgi:hypothetical protein
MDNMKTDKFVLLVDITVTLVHQEMNVLFVLETESIHQPVRTCTDGYYDAGLAECTECDYRCTTCTGINEC